MKQISVILLNFSKKRARLIVGCNPRAIEYDFHDTGKKKQIRYTR